MNPSEIASARVWQEIARKYRLESERLREELREETEACRMFDADNLELFQVVHENHERRSVRQ